MAPRPTPASFAASGCSLACASVANAPERASSAMLNCTARAPRERQTTATTPTTSRSLPWPTALLVLSRSAVDPEERFLVRPWGSDTTFALRLPRPPVVARAAPRGVPPLEAPLELLRPRASFAGLLLLSPAIYYVLPIATIIGLEIFAVWIPHIEIPPGQSPDPPRFRKLRDLHLEPLCFALCLLLLLLQTYYLIAEPGRHRMHVDAPQHQQHRHYHQHHEPTPSPRLAPPFPLRCPPRRLLRDASRGVPLPN